MGCWRACLGEGYTYRRAESVIGEVDGEVEVPLQEGGS